MNPKDIARLITEDADINLPRNLLTSYDDTLLAMAEIEGESWLNRQFEQSGEYSTLGALKEIQRRQQEFKEWQPDPEYPDGKPLDLNDTITTVVYGAGGWNRYVVRGTGEVMLSRGHASPADIKLAEQLGFRTL